MKTIWRVCLTVFLFLLVSYPYAAYAETLIANDFTKQTPQDTTLSFSKEDFTQNANPPAGKSLVSVRFDQVTNEKAGNLKLGGNTVKKGNTIAVNDLNRLTFVPNAGYRGEAIFTWTANYGGASSPFPGAVVITVGSGQGTPSVIFEEEKDSLKEPEQQKTEEKVPPKKETSVKEETKKDSNSEKKEDKTKVETPKSETPKATQNELKPLRYEDMLNHWGAYSAGMLASRGYIIGEDYGNRFYFHPDEIITRLDFVLMVNAIFGVSPKDSLNGNPFSDKNVPSYVMRVGIAAHEYDIIEGAKGKDGKLYFRPNEPITRAEAITILDYALRLDSYGVNEAEFKDVNQIPAWAMQSVRNLEAYGIIQGYEDGTIRPNSNITRAQAAEMVWQVLKFLDVKRNTNAVFQTIILGD